MNSILERVTAKQFLMAMNLFILAIHASLFVLFAVLHVTLMAYVNVCSIVCYCACFFLVLRKRVTEYIIVAYVEILIHTILVVLCVGTAPGFQVYFVGTVGIILFSQYFSVHVGIKPINGIIMSIVCGILYILTLFIDQVHTPLYSLSHKATFGFLIMNSVLLFSFIILFFGLVTNVASVSEMKLTKQASHDNLTGLLNRHYLTEYMNDIYQSENLENCWLAIIDIDNFKTINDRYGHLCGDYVLRSVADILKQCCGDCIVCRWGGEEFMIVGVDTNQENGVTALLESVRSTIADKEFSYDNNTKLHLTVTIGTAHYQSGQTLDAWVNFADSLLYDGKQTGKNRVIS